MNYNIILTVIIATLISVGANAQSIVGSWHIGNAGQADSSVILTFLSDGSYYMAEDGDSVADPSGQDGMERGTYTWNSSTGAFSATTLVDTSGEWGLSHPSGITTVTVTGNELSYNDGGESFTLTRVFSAPGEILGSWRIGNAGQADSSVILTFLDNGSYYMAEDGDSVADPSGQDGMERGTYTWNLSTGAFSATTLVDTSGEWGLSHPIGITTISVTGNSLSYNDGGESFILQRVAETQLAPEQADMAAKLPGRTVVDTQYTSPTRFTYEEVGEPVEFGNWSYTKVSANVGVLTLTYDHDGNAFSDREEIRLIFDSETTGTYTYDEYEAGVVDEESSGSFDLPWLANNNTSVNINASSTGAGTITPSGSLVVAVGADQVFTATPSPGYQVDVWRVNSNVVQSGGSTYNLLDVQSSLSVEVSFVPSQPVGGLAPESAEMAAKLSGRTVNNTQFTSSTRFVYQGAGGIPEPGNWSYSKVSANVGLLTQTYDDDGNNANLYREETSLTFVTETTGTFVYREFDGGVLDFESSGNFDYPWLADNTSVNISASSTGAGVISPSGSLVVDAGTDQTFTATPNAGYEVDVWRMNGQLVQSGGSTYTLSNVQSSTSLEVSFKLRQLANDEIEAPDTEATPPPTTPASPVAAETSKFSGFLTDDNGEAVGYFSSIKISKTGALSAKLIVGGESYSIKGQLDENGEYTSEDLAKAGLGKAILRVRNTASGGRKILGSVEIDNITASISAVQAGPTTQQAGNYTVLLPNKENELGTPQGQGYGFMNVKTTGTAKIKGLLGDGSKWTAKCNVTPDGEMPMFANLYLKKGSLAGLIRFRNVLGVSDCDGRVSWIKPAGTNVAPYLLGFSLQRNLIGSRFLNTGARLITGLASGVSNVEAHVGAGSGEPFVSYDLELTDKNKLNFTGLEKVKIKISKKGQIKGSVSDDGTKWKVAGVIFQKQNLGAGLVYVNGGEPRRLTIVPLGAADPE